MKIAALTFIAALAQIAIYLLVYKFNIIPNDINVNIFWIVLILTFVISFIATAKQKYDA